MDTTNTMESVNLLAVLVAGLSAFLVGGIWYGPLFGRLWQQANNLSDTELQARNLPLVFGLSAVLALVAAANLALFIGPDTDLAFGTFAGAAAGIGWVATMFGIVYLFERRSLTAYWINAGYCAVALTIMGAILGAW